MTPIIIYQAEDNRVVLVYPRSDMSIQDVANRDIPAGAPYRFVNLEDLPSDRTFLDAWEADFSSPDGYSIGADAWIAEQAAIKAAEEAAAEAEQLAQQQAQEEVANDNN